MSRCIQQVKKLGFICPECKITPQRFFIDLFYNGERIRIFSDKHDEALDTFQRVLNFLSHINYEINHLSSEASKYIAGDIRKNLSENLNEKWLETKNRTGLALSYIPKLKQFNHGYFSFFKGHDVSELRTSHIHEFLYKLSDRLKNKTKKISRLHSGTFIHGFTKWSI